jgi:hypothetical protein
LVAGDYRGNGRSDLAIGVPEESYGGFSQAGVVEVLDATRRGLTGVGSQLWARKTSGVPGAPHDQDVFGWAVR